MVNGIIIVGWRSDEGAFLVDASPENTEVDGQDLMNLFSLHRMAANGIMEKAGPDFNYLRLSDGSFIASWYSGFRTTKYIGKPNFCVALVLRQGENPNAWEEPLRPICFNVLSKLEDDDLLSYMDYVLSNINQGFAIEPFEGYVADTGDSAPVQEVAKTSVPNLLGTSTPAPAQPAAADDDFSDLLAMAEEQASARQGSESRGAGGVDPFASASNPFGASSAQSADPFAGDPFASKAKAAPSGGFTPATSPSVASPKGLPLPTDDPAPETRAILQELQNLDRTMPSKPSGDDQNAIFAFYEKKVAFLEAKIGVFGKLIRGLQAKEVELNEKNDLIAKLLALLS
jgi:hypothetical protein